MHIAVCVKQVPDTTEVRIDPETNTLVREGVPSILNPYDAHAAEAAVQIKERYGAHVTVVCMGPPQATEVIRECISYGADRGILLSDRAFAGSDTWATSYTIGLALQGGSRAGLDRSCAGCRPYGTRPRSAPTGATACRSRSLTYAWGSEEIDLETKKGEGPRRLERGVECETALPCCSPRREMKRDSLLVLAQ